MKILNIAGARPNFMKIAPLMKTMGAEPRFDARLIHTGQHYDDEMSKVFFDELGIPPPALNLQVGGGTRESQIERIMEKFDPVVRQERPDAVLVVGDVNSTIACARVARSHGVKVVHVEAGLRSFDTAMPEEVNRVETDQISDFLFVTEPSGMVNLEKEGIAGRAFHVGNVMIDTLVAHLDQAIATSTVAADNGLSDRGYFVATFHRPSNVDQQADLENVIQIWEFVAERLPLFIPLHPRTRGALEKYGLMGRVEGNARIHLGEPLGYFAFIGLVAGARGIVTDSGGVQEETTYLRVPCVTMRDNTERPITADMGSNVLAGTEVEAVKAAVGDALDGPERRGAVPELWDGQTALRIADQLLHELSGP